MSFQSRSAEVKSATRSRAHLETTPLTLLQRLKTLKSDLELVRRTERGRVVEHFDSKERDHRHLPLRYTRNGISSRDSRTFCE